MENNILRILHIEDNLVDQMAFARLLKKSGMHFQLENAETIQAATQKLSEARFHVIISDLNLPDGSAFDLSDWFSKIPVLIHSGHIDDEITIKASQLGAHQVILKSNDLNPLFQALQTFIKKGNDQTQEDLNPLEVPKTTNTDILDHLRSIFGNDEGYMKDLIDVYLKENPALLEKLHQAGLANDRKQVQETAHRIKSGYLLMGLKKLHELASEIEINATDKQGTLVGLINTLRDQSLQSYQQFKQSLQNLQESE